MPDTRLLPLAGMNNVAEDAALRRGGDAPSLDVRDAVNVDITPAGKMDLRAGMALACGTRYRNLWQSPLHGDVFATLHGDWGRLGVQQDPWSFDSLTHIGDGRVSHIVLNNLVAACGPEGIFTYNGQKASRLTIPTPAAPIVMPHQAGSLRAGVYGVALAWLAGEKESGLSAAAHIDVTGGGLSITLPLAVDDAITGVRLYMTRPNGGELLRQGDYPAGTTTLTIPAIERLGEPARFQHMSPMPAGEHFAYWRGRLLTARANVLRFSEALAYHLHDARHGFVQMPQRITFAQPVDGGIWVGQVDHVAFLEGDSPAGMRMRRKTSHAPVPFSATAARAEDVGDELSQGGMASAVWLAENGFVVGTAGGQVVELHANRIKGISALVGSTVGLDGRFTAVTI